MTCAFRKVFCRMTYQRASGGMSPGVKSESMKCFSGLLQAANIEGDSESYLISKIKPDWYSTCDMLLSRHLPAGNITVF